MKALIYIAVLFSCGLGYAHEHRGWICKLSFFQSPNYYCRFTYELSKLNINQDADSVIADFTYDNDPAPDNVGCTYGGIETADAATQLRNAKSAAATLKDQGICRVVIREF